VRPSQLVWAPLRRQRVQGIVLDLYRREAGGWVLQDGAPYGNGEPIERLRPAPEGPAAPEPLLRDLIDLADPEAALAPAQVRVSIGCHWCRELFCREARHVSCH